MWEVGVCLVALLVVWVSHWVYRWANPRCENGKLPPGSMGFPIIGETLQFFSSHSFYDIPPFIQRKITRHGLTFKTSLIGQKVVISADPEVNYKLLQQENQSLIVWYTDSFLGIVGKEKDLMAVHGGPHKYLKNLMLQFLGPENVRGKLMPKIDEATRTHLHSWATHGSVDLKDGVANIIYESYAKNLLSYDDDTITKTLLESFEAFMEGLISVPLYFPGTAFYTCIQGRKKAMKIIKDMYEKRKASKVRVQHDLLDRLLEEVEKENSIVDDSLAMNLIFVLLFVAYEAGSQGLMLLTKFVSENPNVLEELTKEHETIIRTRDDENSGVTLDEYKSMTFTHMVINESVRLANLAPLLLRKVVKDIDINGYKIPAGWIFFGFTSVMHLDPEKYDNPLAFNPWRWEGKELHSGSKNFMAFGGGVRLCLGAEFAKIQMAIYLHYLVTKYRWSVAKGGEVIRNPTLSYPNGMRIAIAEKHK